MSIQLRNSGFLRAGGLSALAAIFVLGSAGCELFGSGDDSDGGGSDTVELSDAVKADVIATVIANGIESLALIAAGSSGCTGSISEDGSTIAGSCDAAGTDNVDKVSCSDYSQTYHMAAGWTLNGGSQETLVDDEEVTTQLNTAFTLTGTFTGGELIEEVVASCEVGWSFDAAEAASFMSGAYGAIDCVTDTLTCTIGDTDYNCDQVTGLLAQLPESCTI